MHMIVVMVMRVVMLWTVVVIVCVVMLWIVRVIVCVMRRVVGTGVDMVRVFVIVGGSASVACRRCVVWVHFGKAKGYLKRPC
ncbi:hypothetical protein [Yanghanlia caeni]|uniref:Secreted peptide n=1 Tax=Yanghanlia caeni TaxID=3064283 RepID=A0ABU1D696_9BURK|nr:hypothetical protein [Alcaligenaceae bacterium LG-2]HZH55767.1 hypothetical protein [Burkholderiaceae bacterium]